MRILIVDDEPTNLRLLRAMLESEDHEVYEASDGVEALSVLDNQTVDAIISDVLMPNMDGFRFCYEVRRNEKIRALPFVTYTATYTSPSDKKMAFEAGTDKYIQKPAPLNVLTEALLEFETDPKYRQPRQPIPESDDDLMRSYNRALVRKLEERNERLERAQAEITKINSELEQRVKERTAELEATNRELEAFSYSAAHDLKAPIRAIDGYSAMILEDCGDKLDQEPLELLNRIRESASRMSTLIDELLNLSSIGKRELRREGVDLSSIVRSVLADLEEGDPQRQVKTNVESGILTQGDPALLRIAFENLLGNAWKFTSKSPDALIEFGRPTADRHVTCFVRDNGAGFDMAQADKLFRPFQRMHSQSEFPGTGLGLTIVQRIVSKHGGRISVESSPGQGTTFYVQV